MSIFSNILSKIFPTNHPAVAAQQQGNTSNAQTGGPGNAQQNQQTAAQTGGGANVGGNAGNFQQPQNAAQGAAVQQVDVEQILDEKTKQSGQKLNWRTSIVDLMKLLSLDSSLEARKTLAHELNYTGDTNDSASMNIWLHKQVMLKLEQNGGKVPQDLVRH